MPQLTRRHFVQASLTGTVSLTNSKGLTATPQSPSTHNRVVLALIGAGGRGMDVIRQMVKLPDVSVKYVCDVENARGRAAAAELAKIQGRTPTHVLDLRRILDDRDVHGVVVATPEQWHALATVSACQAGKDVYVEKNISLSIWEGRKMIEAARKYRRIVQAGFQNRSAPYGFSARDYIARGGLGKVLYVNIFGMLPTTYGGYPLKKIPDEPIPRGLDWDRWLGPARERSYNRDVHRNWYGYWDFSGGNASDAIHTLDLARLALGDPPHPRIIQCLGGRFQYNDGGDMPDVQIVSYQFEKSVRGKGGQTPEKRGSDPIFPERSKLVVSFLNTGFTPYNSKSPGEVRFGKKFPYWPQNADRIEIFGTKRMMYLGRHGAGWQVFEADGKLVAEDKGYHPDKWHIPNFIDCIRNRKQPNGDIEQGHLSACLEHFANVAYRTGNQRLVFDARSEIFVDNPAANAMLRPHYRKDYRVPEQV